MSTHDTHPQDNTRHRSTSWAVPGTAVVIGVAYFVVGLVGDNATFGIAGCALMIAIAALFWWGSRRSETLAFLADRRDERINQLDLRASHFAGMVVLFAVLAMFMLAIARGHDGSPYYQLAALGGVSYAGALVWLRLRG